MGSRQDWRTPPSIFGALSKFFGGFSFDAAASHDNHLCEKYATEDDGPPSWNLWCGHDVWVNPPFNAIGPFVRQAADYVADDGVFHVVMLTHANPNSPWFQEAIGSATLYCPDRRINYWHPNEDAKHGANRDTVVWHFGGPPGRVYTLPLPEHQNEVRRLTAESNGQLTIGSLL